MTVKNIAVMVKTLNLATGAGLIVISVLSIIDIKEWFTFKVFLIPCPFFVAFFGLCIIGAELKIKSILKYFEFLKSLMGRGLFNVFLSSMTFWFLQGSQVLAWASAIILFVIGVIYIALHCGYNKELKEAYEQEQTKNQKVKEKEAPIRENLI